MIRVGGDLERYRRRCAEVTLAATFGVPYAMPYERDRPILVCRGMHVDLRRAWSELQHIDRPRRRRPNAPSGTTT